VPGCDAIALPGSEGDVLECGPRRVTKTAKYRHKMSKQADHVRKLFVMPQFSSALLSIYSQDMPRSVEFYGTTLGLEESYRFPRDGGEPLHVEFRVGSTTLAVSSPIGLASHGMPPPTPGHSFEIGLKTEDVDALINELREKGVTILREPFSSPAGNRTAYFADPDGTWISVYHKLPA